MYCGWSEVKTVLQIIASAQVPSSTSDSLITMPTLSTLSTLSTWDLKLSQEISGDLEIKWSIMAKQIQKQQQRQMDNQSFFADDHIEYWSLNLRTSIIDNQTLLLLWSKGWAFAIIVMSILYWTWVRSLTGLVHNCWLTHVVETLLMWLMLISTISRGISRDLKRSQGISWYLMGSQEMSRDLIGPILGLFISELNILNMCIWYLCHCLA